jgi:hypothetical protein
MTEDAAPTPEQARAIARDAYVFTYPSVMNYRTMFMQAIKGDRQFGKWLHLGLSSPADTDIVTPNNDTPYWWPMPLGTGEAGTCGSGSGRTMCSPVQTDSNPAASAACATRSAVTGSLHGPMLMANRPTFITRPHFGSGRSKQSSPSAGRAPLRRTTIGRICTITPINAARPTP